METAEKQKATVRLKKHYEGDYETNVRIMSVVLYQKIKE